MKEFTEDEKTIARNICQKYKWIARDIDGTLCVYEKKPKKRKIFWNMTNGTFDQLEILESFSHMFKSIKWEDNEPTRISDICNPQILDDVEREYLKTILKPFHEEVEYVEKLGSHLLDEYTFDKEYLRIHFYDGEFIFQDFDAGKMYSGMKRNEPYRLEELGITYKDGKDK